MRLPLSRLAFRDSCGSATSIVTRGTRHKALCLGTWSLAGVQEFLLVGVTLAGRNGWGLVTGAARTHWRVPMIGMMVLPGAAGSGARS